MADPPRITVVTPSFGQGQFLRATIRSVLEQDYPNLEYIVMDGGSTDGSVEIIRQYESRLAHWVSRKDGGQADAVAAGFEKATGEVLCYLNSDDLLLPGALKTVGDFFARHPHAHFLVGGSVLVNPKGRTIRHEWPHRVTFESMLFWGCGFSQPASFWTKEAYERVGGIDRRFQFCLDLDFYLRLLKNYRAFRIRKYFAAFRTHPQAKTTRLQEIHRQELREILERWGYYRVAAPQRRLLFMRQQAKALLRRGVVRLRHFSA